ncbi:MAG: hypothetical protein HS108_09690 [Planctomycetes bacterium]|nr:hypothetical protein [Planctomycetota bacterium]MCL4731390.1 hypothetical protein [Planctomycetota bacterium]
MHFFEIVPWVLLAAAVAGAALSIGFVARSLRREEQAAQAVPLPEYDCRETALIAWGEGVRRDC